MQRVVAEQEDRVDNIFHESAVHGAPKQVSKRLLRRHIERCISEAFASGSGRGRERKTRKILGIFSRSARSGQ
jgi:DNA-binding FrmR family transcriptional regulator